MGVDYDEQTLIHIPRAVAMCKEHQFLIFTLPLFSQHTFCQMERYLKLLDFKNITMAANLISEKL